MLLILMDGFMVLKLQNPKFISWACYLLAVAPFQARGIYGLASSGALTITWLCVKLGG